MSSKLLLLFFVGILSACSSGSSENKAQTENNVKANVEQSSQKVSDKSPEGTENKGTQSVDKQPSQDLDNEGSTPEESDKSPVGTEDNTGGATQPEKQPPQEETPVYVGKSINSGNFGETGTVNFNKHNLILNIVDTNHRQINKERVFDLNELAQTAVETKNLLVLEQDKDGVLLSIFTGDVKGKNVISSYMGYYQAVNDAVGVDVANPDEINTLTHYIQGGSQDLKASVSDLTELNATYQGNMLFGAKNEAVRSAFLTLTFKDKKITGEVKDARKGSIVYFDVTGDVDALYFKPKSEDYKDRGTSTPEFYHSSTDNHDSKYMSGVVKADDWGGAYNTEMQGQ